MEPFEIRTIPARLPGSTVATAAGILGVLVLTVVIAIQTTFQVLRSTPDGSSQAVVLVLLLLVIYGLLWIFVRSYAPTLQVVGMYLFRDRGKQVVAYRLDESGWRHVVAGTDVVIPWEGIDVAVTERTDAQYHLRLTSDGPFAAGRDPFSRQVRRTLSKEHGLAIPMTTADPTEDELASAIAQQSAGRVALAR